MKKLLPIIAIFIVFSASSQKKNNSKTKIFNDDLRLANIYYANALYAKAIPLYEKIDRKHWSDEVLGNLANCYYNIGALKTSARFYGYLVNRKKELKTYKNIFKYVQALKASGNYADANSVMREYLVDSADVEVVNKFDKAIKKHENITAIGNRFITENLEINTEKSEFGMIPYNDFLVFAAANQEILKDNILNSFYGWNQEPFLDIYKVHKDSLQSRSNIQSISSKVNTKLHEGTVAFTKDGKTMYFTRNNFHKRKEHKDKSQITHLKLYKAQLIDSVWKQVEPLPFNGDDFSVEHPALSHDGKRLYFASDMPGTIGSFDLFYVTINEDGTYGNPINLGLEINTKHREQFPFIAVNGDLFFSSNGHYGFGGLDVFWSQYKTGVFQTPDNLGLPLNSGHDDFAFFLDNTLKSGYFSSNRLEGKGADDIYKFSEIKKLIIEDCKQLISGIITDKDTKYPIKNATVTLTLLSDSNDKNKEIDKHNTKEDGAFKTNINCNIKVLVTAIANGYKEAKKIVVIDGGRNKDNDASMALISIASINKKIEEEKQKALQKQNDIKKKEQEQALKKRKQEEENKVKEIENIIAAEPKIKREKDRLIIDIAQIHFDYKLWYVRTDVKNILKSVLSLMNKYPKMQIEIESHTDIRGHKAYNKDLSQKRATSTKEYLVSQGIEPYRITAIGYGESKPILFCESEDACTEEEHEINRRSEFVIKKIL